MIVDLVFGRIGRCKEGERCPDANFTEASVTVF